MVSGFQVIPDTDDDVTVGTLGSAVEGAPEEGAPVEEAETEKAALPTGEEASLEEANIDTVATEIVDGDRSQPEETEVAARQVSIQMKWGSREKVPVGMPYWATAVTLLDSDEVCSRLMSSCSTKKKKKKKRFSERVVAAFFQ